MAAALKLISHKLCPYVQRAVIALNEKGVPFERIDIDLANKPDWFLKISPLGKTPVLVVGDKASAFFEMHRDPANISRRRKPAPSCIRPIRLQRAEHRAWMEFGSADPQRYRGALETTDGRRDVQEPSARQLEREICAARGARSAQARCSPAKSSRLVDAVFAPGLPLFRRVRRDRPISASSRKPKVARWREELAKRP